MTSPAPHHIPPGWYPDPSGARRWRVWTGSQWSELTRPYGEPSAPPLSAAGLPLVNALHRLVTYGILTLFAGLGLIVSLLAHWPGTAQPLPLDAAVALLALGVGLGVIGTAAFAVAERELEGRWTIVAVLPGINVLAVTALVAQRIVGRYPARSVIAEVILLGLFIAEAHAQPWLAAAVVIAAWDHLRTTSALLDQVSGPVTR